MSKRQQPSRAPAPCQGIAALMLDSVFAWAAAFVWWGLSRAAKSANAARPLKQNPYRERFIRVETFHGLPARNNSEVRSTMRKLFARPLLAVLTAAMLVAGPSSPLLAQEQAQNPKPQASPEKGGTYALGSAKYNFTKAPRPFPNLIAPYRPVSVGPQ